MGRGTALRVVEGPLNVASPSVRPTACYLHIDPEPVEGQWGGINTGWCASRVSGATDRRDKPQPALGRRVGCSLPFPPSTKDGDEEPGPKNLSGQDLSSAKRASIMSAS